MSTSYTPGPWKAVPWGKTITIDTEKRAGIAFINPLGSHDSGIPNGQDTANARLIIAAPEMRDSLANIIRYVDRNGMPSYIEGVESVVVNIPSLTLRKARAILEEEEAAQ